jgi:hypothetical protein
MLYKKTMIFLSLIATTAAIQPNSASSTPNYRLFAQTMGNTLVGGLAAGAIGGLTIGCLSAATFNKFIVPEVGLTSEISWNNQKRIFGISFGTGIFKLIAKMGCKKYFGRSVRHTLTDSIIAIFDKFNLPYNLEMMKTISRVTDWAATVAA